MKTEEEIIEAIETVHQELKTEMKTKTLYNTKETREYIKNKFNEAIPELYLVKSDEENNSPDVVGSNKLICRVCLKPTNNGAYKYRDLEF